VNLDIAKKKRVHWEANKS